MQNTINSIQNNETPTNGIDVRRGTVVFRVVTTQCFVDIGGTQNLKEREREKVENRGSVFNVRTSCRLKCLNSSVAFEIFKRTNKYPPVLRIFGVGNNCANM
jgi:hypothetical protein